MLTLSRRDKRRVDDLLSVDPRAQLLLDEARRQLDQQKADLAGLRQRAASTLGFATVLVSLALAGVAASGVSAGPWTWAGIVAYGLTVLCSFAVLWPAQMRFSLEIPEMASRVDDTPPSHLIKEAALGIDESCSQNARRLGIQHWAYRASLCTTVLQVVALALLVTNK